MASAGAVLAARRSSSSSFLQTKLPLCFFWGLSSHSSPRFSPLVSDFSSPSAVPGYNRLFLAASSTVTSFSGSWHPFFCSSFHHVLFPDLSIPGWRNAVKVWQRSFAKSKKSRDDESTVSEDVYPKIKQTVSSLMEASLDALSRELAKLRTGRASAGMLDHVTVEHDHGVRSSLSNVAAVSVLDSLTLRVMPYDISMVKKVERAIRSSPLQLNPVCEGDNLIVNIPKPTQENMESMIKLVGKAGEATKQSLRRARQNAMESIKKSSACISKDDIKRQEKEVEEITKKFLKSAEDICKAKEKEMSFF